MNEERDARICEMYEAGKSMRAVGEVFGLTTERVRQILSRCGVTTRHFNGRAWPKGVPKPWRRGRDVCRDLWSIDEDELLLKLVGDGMALAHIALEMGKTREAVKGRSWRLRNARPGEALPKYAAPR